MARENEVRVLIVFIRMAKELHLVSKMVNVSLDSGSWGDVPPEDE
jgi:hypothetical protein